MAPKQNRSTAARHRSRNRAVPSSRPRSQRRASRRSSRVSRRGTPALRGGVRFAPEDDTALREAVNLMKTNRPTALTLYGPLRTWDTSRVVDFSEVFESFTFEDQQPGGDDDITGWDTSAATAMKGMFRRCQNFDQALRFDTSNVTSMMEMFDHCFRFNQPVDFDTVAVTNMDQMFFYCLNFNQPVNFVTPSLTTTFCMFMCCEKFNQPVNLNTASVRVMSSMFERCSAFNQPLNFNTQNVTRYDSMFEDCSAFNQPLNRWFHRPTRSEDALDDMVIGCVSFQSPVFAMSVVEYDQSGLDRTPLGRLPLMIDALEDADRVAARDQGNQSNLDEQGRLIKQGSVAAATQARTVNRNMPSHLMDSSRDLDLEQAWTPTAGRQKTEQEKREGERDLLRTRVEHLRARIEGIEGTVIRRRQALAANKADLKQRFDTLLETVRHRAQQQPPGPGQTEQERIKLAELAAALTDNNTKDQALLKESAPLRIRLEITEREAERAERAAGAGAGADNGPPAKRARHF